MGAERGHEPWLAALRERVEECYAAPMLSRDEALALLEIADAAQEFIATTTVFQQRRVSRDAFTRLAVAVHWPSDPRATNSHPGSDA